MIAETDRRSRYRCLVLDFDGTLTDVEATTDRFLNEYRARLSAKLVDALQLQPAAIASAWDVANARFLADRASFGWEHGGEIVAPAGGDPYLRATWTAHATLTTLAPHQSTTDHAAITGPLYRAAYEAEAPTFRDDAAAVIDRLVSLVDVVAIVTNSPADAVATRLRRLPSKRLADVMLVGDAKKFVVCASSSDPEAFATIADHTTLDGLARPVWLRRGCYFDALSKVRKAAKASFDEMLVCGDIFELDLALPSALGASVHLLRRESTLPHEIAAAENVTRGGVGTTLSSVLDRFDAAE